MCKFSLNCYRDEWMSEGSGVIDSIKGLHRGCFQYLGQHRGIQNCSTLLMYLLGTGYIFTVKERPTDVDRLSHGEKKCWAHRYTQRLVCWSVCRQGTDKNGCHELRQSHTWCQEGNCSLRRLWRRRGATTEGGSCQRSQVIQVGQDQRQQCEGLQWQVVCLATTYNTLSMNNTGNGPQQTQIH